MRNFLAGKATPVKSAPSSSIPSSSPAFATPAHPIRPYVPDTDPSSNTPTGLPSTPTPAKQAILPIVLAPGTLRPLAFRTFTKKHSLTLTSTALQELAGFIGRHCGSGWREEGLAEKVLEEVARSWKNCNGGVIVDGTSAQLREILKTLEGGMSGGRLVVQTKRSLLRQDSLTLDSSAVSEADVAKTRLGITVPTMARADSGLGTQEDLDEIDDVELNDVRKWLKVVDAFEQPRLVYNVTKKHFERVSSKPSILPSATSKTTAFRHRYHVIHQRLMRNEAFQTSAVASLRSSSSSAGQKLTPIANLLGRHGSHHMLLGLLTTLPTGGTGLSDLTGTISLDLSQAVSVPHDCAWFTAGMLVLVDGIYEEDDDATRSAGLPGARGVGGFVGGRFQAFFIGQPPSERRAATLGITAPHGDATHTIGGGFGWTDFLGLGSERAVGAKMRRIEDRLLRGLSPANARMRRKVVVLGEVNLNKPHTLEAVRKILGIYAGGDASSNAAPLTYPLAFVITGSFTDGPIMARGGSGGSVEYKEYFDALAAVIGDFPALMAHSSFIFVPGDNDGWISAATAGASVPLPRQPVPDMFTSRLRRMFAAARSSSNGGATAQQAGPRAPPEAIWTTNPSRLALFGPTHEVVVFRDDVSARLRRAAVALKADRDALRAGDAPAADGEDGEDVPADLDDLMEVEQPADQDIDPGVKSSRKLVKTLLDQGHLAPFRPEIRPVHWDYAGALQLYPLPTAVILVDSTSNPFSVTYEGCHVLNPGTLLVAGRKGQARWAEYEVGRTGKFRECSF
ncbi:hypothetical protein TD95_003941 [Thielaviopsis punctulata]|uniref:DNA polymerase epsilon subunit B n=1 Tax=Thielaviopsis punctulata TaxID=72032 RepID=A0A0F4ZEF7_9PEZI|nr:hypothetical protein TD95_003941 [Thielaviopsis punctulata]